MGGLHVDFRLRAHHGETWATADGPCEVGVEQTQGRFEDETCSGLDARHRHLRLMDLRIAMICDPADELTSADHARPRQPCEE
jgi:hypothetical protein